MTAAAKRKLIEVALPLEAINREAVREKQPFTRDHPRALHIWWARRPLTACRAVLFASLVDDPSSDPDRFPTEADQKAERQRLFGIIEQLMKWENAANEDVLTHAREEIGRSMGNSPPPVVDPFCGGGSIPLEAQRLGLMTHASDLNPVAVLITKALVEIPPKFANQRPVHPDALRGVGGTGAWKGAAGLAEDVQHYGAWMREEAQRLIGHLYPKARLPKDFGGGEATVIAWLWARTVTCPNPGCGARMPLVRSFELSRKKGKEAWVVPVGDRAAGTVSFTIGGPPGKAPEPPKTGRGANFRCLLCDQVAPEKYVKAEGRAKRLGSQLMAMVAEGRRSRVYLPPDLEHSRIAELAEPTWGPDQYMPDNPRWFSPPAFGMATYRDLFTSRQLVALTTLSDLVAVARERVVNDALQAGLPDEKTPLGTGGRGAIAYGEAVATYLALAVSRWSDLNNSIASWNSTNESIRALFARQAIPMSWDYADVNAFSSGVGIDLALRNAVEAVRSLPARGAASVQQLDATSAGLQAGIISTDPPYYDNIGYADLSDFFYVWLRRSLGDVYPALFSTVLTPKAAELVATPAHFEGDKSVAERHFQDGLAAAFHQVRLSTVSSVPVTVYYAFKQAESDDIGDGPEVAIASTGWQTMLSGLIVAGLSVVGTWPLRTERSGRSVSIGTNALASSIVLVCRPRPPSAPLATFREFTETLSHELPEALTRLQDANIAPVDLAQAAIGPGMAVFTRYSGVLEQATGGRMTVRRALELINAELDAHLTAEHRDLDRDTRWCHTWFRNHGFNEGDYGSADTLAKARNVSVAGLQEAGVLVSHGGMVRLLRPDELSIAWDPLTDERLTLWECTHQLVRALHDAKGGVEAAARLVARMGQGRAAEAKDLAYGLFGICERKGWRDEAGDYNDLVIEWPAIAERAREIGATGQQDTLGI